MYSRSPRIAATPMGNASNFDTASWMCRESSQRPGRSSKNKVSSKTSTQRGAAHGSDLAILSRIPSAVSAAGGGPLHFPCAQVTRQLYATVSHTDCSACMSTAEECPIQTTLCSVMSIRSESCVLAGECVMGKVTRCGARLLCMRISVRMRAAERAREGAVMAEHFEECDTWEWGHDAEPRIRRYPRQLEAPRSTRRRSAEYSH